MDEALEAAIDEVGRDRVFAVARYAGWGPMDAPPTYVWWSIVHDLHRADAMGEGIEGAAKITVQRVHP